MNYAFNWSVLWEHRQLLLDGLVATVQLSLAAILFSVAVGIVVASLRSVAPAPVRALLTAYVEFFRNVPPIVQFFFWYFAVGLDVYPAAIIGLSAFTGAYVAEVIRAGILSIPKTQTEAARAQGMSQPQVLGLVILPQAAIRIVPPLSVEFINVLKNSSVAMTIGLTELTFATQEIEARTFRGFEAATAVTLLYVALACVIVGLAHLAERMARLDLRRG
jgi:His/Glu/Gln/Arg/opine family amino acid ABC transporter permease subunit